MKILVTEAPVLSAPILSTICYVNILKIKLFASMP